jgi:hypothetical protein
MGNGSSASLPASLFGRFRDEADLEQLESEGPEPFSVRRSASLGQFVGRTVVVERQLRT